MDENETDRALRSRAAQLNEAIDGDGPRRLPLADVLADTPARPPTGRGIRTALALGLAAAGILVVALAIVLSGFTRGPVVPNGSSSSAPATSSMPPTATNSLPPASSSPTGSASTTPVPTTDPRAVSFATGPSLGDVLWAPDGKTFAVLDQVPAVIHFFSRAGKSLGDTPGRNVAWIDATRYILLRWLDAGSFTTQAFIGQVGQTELTQIPGVYGEELLGNGHGAVALTMPGVNSQYVLWSSSEVSKPRAGQPVSWSKDGRELAVVYIDQAAVKVWFEVVGLTGQRIAAVDVGGLVEGLQVAFSPDGRNVALSAGPRSLPCILNVPTGRTVSMGSAPAISIAWAGDTRLLIVPPDPIPRFLTEWDLGGKPVEIPAQAADLVSVPNTEVVALVQEDLSDFTVAPSALVLLEPPKEPITINFASRVGLPFWSPDGQVGVVVSYYQSNPTEAFLIAP
jgi:hypothetical protein